MSILDMPTELMQTITEHLCDPDLLAFRSTCRFADSITLRTVGRRYFTTLRTTLTRLDLDSLEGISRNDRLARYVKTIRIRDSGEHIKEHLFKGPPALGNTRGAWRLREMYVRNRRRACRSWPRAKATILDADNVAISRIQTILETGRFVLDALCIQEVYESFGIDKEAAIVLALEIILNTKFAITSLRVETAAMWTATVTFRFDREKQGQTTGFSILREADVDMGNGPASYHLLDQLLYRAPLLEDLRLANLDARGRSLQAPFDASITRGVPPAKLKRVRLEKLTCPVSFVQEILCNSRHTLKHISLVSVLLSDTGFVWKELLLYISKGFPDLESFDLKDLGDVGPSVLDFSVIGSRALEMTSEGEVRFSGPYDEDVKFQRFRASDALRAIAFSSRMVG